MKTKTSKSMTQEQREEYRQLAQAKAQAALDRLDDGIRSVWESERWESWLKSLSKFYTYSLGNTLLISMQMPQATHVASYKSWKRDFNRYVKKGEKGIEILVPMLVKDRSEDEDTDEERRRLVGFKVGHVWDVSQTDGEPLPSIVDEVGSEVERYEAVLDAVRTVSKYPVEFTLDLPADVKGVFRRGDRIAIRSDMPEGQTVKTALHELAHSRMHEDPDSVPDRRLREMQAESVAYAVSAALGLDTSGYSFGYVASWAVGKSDEEMRQCMQVVRDEAKAMIEELQQAMAA